MSATTKHDLDTPGSRRFYAFARSLVIWLSAKPWRVHVHGADRLPADGPFILAPSHRSMLDITWLTLVTKRRIRFMGKVSLFKIPVLGGLFERLGAFAVERDGSDRAPLRASLEILKGGDVLAVYPEGTRQHGREIQELQPGAAYLALKAQVPIVPVGIAGAEEAFRGGSRFPRFGPGVLVVGSPIVPAERTGSVVKRELVDELNAQLAVQLQAVFDEAYLVRDARTSR